MPLIYLYTIIIAIISNMWIELSTQRDTTSDMDQVAPHRVGLVLGTSKYTTDGHLNLYFKYRVDAAVELFANGKVEYLLVSGDNSTKSYDEPTAFKDALVIRGVPADRIYLDYAGFRALDSVVRAREVFGLQSVVIISQEFHNERAVFIAKAKGVDAVGFNAREVPTRYSLKTSLREILARTKVFFDLSLGVQPKFLGTPIEIGKSRPT